MKGASQGSGRPRIGLRALAVALIVAASGCVQGEANLAQSSSVAPAPAPAAKVDAGSVSGRVVDDELRPLSGVRVALVEPGAEAATDAEGRYTFNDVAPGSYRVIFGRLGYEDVARRVEVRAGEVTTVDVTLKAVEISSEPYHVAMNKNALIHLDFYYVAYYHYYYLNNSNVNNLRCDPCVFVLHIEKNPKSVMMEARWPPSGVPVINPSTDLYYYKDWTPTTIGTYVCGYYIRANPFSWLWTDTCVKNARNADKLKLNVFGADLGISFEHKVESWTTFGYQGELPDDYTAFPPR